MFYTYCELIGNRIFHRYINDAGENCSEVIKEFPIKLYIKGKKQKDSSVGLHGEVLNAIEFNSISDAKEFRYQYIDILDIYGQSQFNYQFISHTYPGEIDFDFSKVKILIIDIETAFDDSGFPTPEKANQQILAITCKVLGKDNKFMSFGVEELSEELPEDVVYQQCRDEKDLLQSFQRHFQDVRPNIITSWNGNEFDIPYIINRSIKVLGEDFVKKFSPFYNQLDKCIIKEEIGVNKSLSYRIVGISNIDYLELYKKFAYSTLESLRLDVVGQYELGEGKVDFSEYGDLMDLYNKDFDKFLRYNIHDVRLVENLEYKLNFLFLTLTIAYIGKINYDEIYSQVRFWDTFIYNSLLQKGIQIPPNSRKDHSEMVGGYVKDPVPGLYSWIVTLDLTSLYPSIIMSFNMSPETKEDTACYSIADIEKFIELKLDTSDLKRKNLTMVANGTTFRRDKQGIMPELIRSMFAKRKMYKGKMFSASKEIETLKDEIKNSETPELKQKLEKKKSEESSLFAMQHAVKISMNSLFGAQANQYFRYYDPDIAEGITMTGQLIIRYISERLNSKLNAMFKTEMVDYIILNDTDSAGLNLSLLVEKVFPDEKQVSVIVDLLDKFVKKYIDPFLQEEFEKLSEYLNVFSNELSMKREIIADRGFFRAKKNYILQVWDKEGIRYHQNPPLKMMGIETAKSSTPQIVRGSLEKAIRIILNEDETSLRSYVKNFRKLFFGASVDQIAFPRGVSDIDKWVDGNSWKKSTPIHVKGCIIFNSLLKKYKLTSSHPSIKNGDKIKFVYLKTPNPYQSNVVSFLDNLYPEFELDKYVDKEIQFSKTFLDPLTSFTKIINWSVEKKSSLSGFIT